MSTSATAPAPRQRPEWRNRVDQASKPVAPSTPPPPASGDDFVITVGSANGNGFSPDVEPGVYRVRCTDIRKETGDNPWKPGTERTCYIFDFCLADTPEEGAWRYYAGTTEKSAKLTTVLAALQVATGAAKSAVVGKECQALVEHNERGYARIKNLFPLA